MLPPVIFQYRCLKQQYIEADGNLTEAEEEELFAKLERLFDRMTWLEQELIEEEEERLLGAP